MRSRAKPDGAHSPLRPTLRSQARRPGHAGLGKRVSALNTEKTERPGTPAKRLAWPVVLFILSLAIPWIINAGPIRLSVYRLVLIILFVPTIAMWTQGKAGKIRVADMALLTYAFWCVLSLIIVHGLQGGLQSSAVTFLESTVPYFLARCYIRDTDDFYNMSRFFFRIFMVFLPFAMIESITNRNVFLELFSAVMPSIPDILYEPRWGLRRVQGFVEHPILFGVCAASIFSFTHLVLGYREATAKRAVRSGLAMVPTVFSLSAGPMGAMIAQAMLIAWDRLMKNNRWRWKILLGVLIVGNMAIAAVPGQSLVGFYISHFTFDQSSAYYRVLIWDYGSESALNHPLFGVGMGDWDHPAWMPDSIDMFWLIHAVRYGIPAGIFMLVAFGAIYLPLCYKTGLNEKQKEYCFAYLLCMTGFFIAGWAVHYWNATYVLFLFLMGSGVWLLEVPGEAGNRKARRRPTRGTASRRLPRNEGQDVTAP